MRKKSIICSRGLRDERVNLFSTILLSSGNSLGCTCMLYYSWISLLLKVHLFPNQSLQNCISTGNFWKIGFHLYGPQRKQCSRNLAWMLQDLVLLISWIYLILHWHWQLLHDPQSCRTPSKWTPYKEVSENSHNASAKLFLFVLHLFCSIWSIPHVSISTHAKQHLARYFGWYFKVLNSL